MFNVSFAIPLLFPWACLSIQGTTAAPSSFEKRASAQVVTHCSVPNTVALTFDDGPYDYLTDTVDILTAAGASGTFFFNGHNWGCIYENTMAKRVRYAYDNGFQIGSHTWRHEHLTKLSPEEVDSQMARVENAIRKITGAIPAYTRPPYGEYNSDTLEVAGARNQILVKWDFDSQDSSNTPANRQKELFDELVQDHPSNILSLQHEVYRSSIHEVLPYAIKILQEAGYDLVTLAECLDSDPYLEIGSPSERDDTWHC